MLSFVCKAENPQDSPASGWKHLSSILEQIEQPKFADQEFSVTNFGAIGDGITLCTDAFNETIKKCNQSGGGKVLIPDGQYLTIVHDNSPTMTNYQTNSTMPDFGILKLKGIPRAGD